MHEEGDVRAAAVASLHQVWKCGCVGWMGGGGDEKEETEPLMLHAHTSPTLAYTLYTHSHIYSHLDQVLMKPLVLQAAAGSPGMGRCGVRGGVGRCGEVWAHFTRRRRSRGAGGPRTHQCRWQPDHRRERGGGRVRQY